MNKKLFKKERDRAFKHYSKFETWLGNKPIIFQKEIAKEIQKRLKLIRLMSKP
jgi:hypothetical protein